MAKNDTGEERKIWPTPRRLQRLRRDGSVPLSKDFQTAMSLLFVVAYLLLFWHSMVARLQTGFLVVNPSMPGGFAEEATRVVAAVGRLTLEVVGPILAMAVFGALFGAMMDGKGFPLKVKELAPDFSRLSPADGLKRIFSLRSLLDFVKGLIVIALVIGGNVLLFRALYNDLMWSPGCGVACSYRMLVFLIGGSIAIGIVVMLAQAFTDLPVSRWMFRRDNRMTISEQKREHRDDEGDPDMRRERRRLARQALEASAFTGIHKASIVLTSSEAAVAISFTQGQTPAPVISARTRTGREEYVRRAGELGLPVVNEPELVVRLLESGQVGAYVPQSTFTDVARVLIIHGIIRTGG